MITDILAAIERGELHPVEPIAHPLEDAVTALRDQQERRVTGKTVLVP
jgi:NADPH:quinone reductase-like Zn-dependent oxidoreductase